MNSKRSRLAVVGVLALAISVTVGLVSGSAADAKKKKHKSGTVTASKTTPTAIPASSNGDSPGTLTAVPLTVGKAAKGKVVGWSSLSVTTSFTGSNTMALGQIRSRLTAPNGRTVSLINPVYYNGNPTSVSGPLTETPDSPFLVCLPQPVAAPCPGGVTKDPEATVGPPYAGTVGNSQLALFGGVPAKGVWTLKVLNTGVGTTAVLNSVSISITLKKAPA
ncbi:MAG: hypothetical protein QOD60_2267 [Solirubrobacterales bacterium]|jgi:hypothetical protein|nr:hypothetical protein [Solirubrobacterales bacterium]